MNRLSTTNIPYSIYSIGRLLALPVNIRQRQNYSNLILTMAVKPLRVQAPEAPLELNKLIETKAVSQLYLMFQR